MNQAAPAHKARLVAAAGNLELLLPECEPGIGSVITAPASTQLIAGVRVEPYAQWPDDRGHFLEVLRAGNGLVAGYEKMQVSVSLCYPGTIKAFHYHLHQTDMWTVAAGMMQVALVDLRKGSSTFGARNTFYLGELRPWRLLIPAGIGHGCKTLGEKSALLVYATDRFYDPQDEGRLPYNSTEINYDWETQHK